MGFSATLSWVPLTQTGLFGSLWDWHCTVRPSPGRSWLRGIHGATAWASLSLRAQADFLGGVMAKWGLKGEGHLPAEGAAQPAGHRPA